MAVKLTGSRSADSPDNLVALGDPAGLDAILEAIRRIPAWDDGWNYRAMGQFGAVSVMLTCTAPLSSMARS